MPIGPIGEERPADVIANAVLSMMFVTGEAGKLHVNAGQSAGGRKGDRVRGEALSAGRRSEVAKWGAKVLGHGGHGHAVNLHCATLYARVGRPAASGQRPAASGRVRSIPNA